ncbi:xylulokinase [Croceivirga sp. JEA036]|uniref:xylulokinase n=1 Tax=Croceivirga sp. JEA036 TaxID=2721162 RepID=UPI001439F7F8|nr:FGGY family carbohydrate kinase [Croceivirga sp. JEA036]NJB38023.1 carbohydrate kinase [Croceivirga sp. JEA036]
MYFLGLDIGSSSVKIALVASDTGKQLAVEQEPKEEMSMEAHQKGWAEQDPNLWWHYACLGIKSILKSTKVSPETIKGIGISYQMHGLVVVDAQGIPLRKAIIWCDSRAVEIGEEALKSIGPSYCTEHLLNSPANFTASKLKWVKDNEPAIFDKTAKFLLPGDYIALKLSGESTTTVSGLSEGIFWDFKQDRLSEELLTHYGFSKEQIPNIVPTFGLQGAVSAKGAEESGLVAGTPILYRAGDQPNNALSLNVFKPGEVAATCGTSGVMYGVTSNLSVKEYARVNNFAHVNYQKSAQKSIGKLLCINGAGIQYRWLKNTLCITDYETMNELASTVAVGSDGIQCIPFGNGAERMLKNKDVGTRWVNINLNRHQKAHLCRAALEGIAFSFVYGFEIMQADGIEPTVIKAGNDNMFRSRIFAETIATLIGQEIALYNTTGAIGAARACVLKEGDYNAFSAYTQNDYVKTYHPKKEKQAYQLAYNNWKKELNLILNTIA